jgi:hypothetical protein
MIAVVLSLVIENQSEHILHLIFLFLDSGDEAPASTTSSGVIRVITETIATGIIQITTSMMHSRGLSSFKGIIVLTI